MNKLGTDRFGMRARLRRRPIERRERALTFLAQLAVLPAGYRVRGVHGWAHPDDFSALAGPHTWAELLEDLEREGVVGAHVASVADAPEPARLYRITQAGMDEVAAVLGEASPAVALPLGTREPAGVYVSAGARMALQALRRVADEWLRPERVTEPPEGWSREVGRPCRCVLALDLDELVAAGLAETRPPEGDGKHGQGRGVYRATPRGLAVPVLAWAGRDPESEIYSQDEGPLLRAPAGVLLLRRRELRPGDRERNDTTRAGCHAGRPGALSRRARE